MKKFAILLAATICVSFASETLAQVKLANIFGDNMVLQRDQPLFFWGTAAPSEDVTVSYQGKSKSTIAMGDGTWFMQMEAIGLGAPFEVTVKGKANEIKLKNVVAGEVWICSGQSNMEWPVNASGQPNEEKAAANYPMIRHVKIHNTIAMSPREDVTNTGWQVSSPQTAGNFTAVGYYFGRHLHKELNVPIGLINTTWGGTIVEAWTSGESLMWHPDFEERIAKIREMAADEQGIKAKEKEIQAWYANFKSALDSKADDWETKDFDTSQWKTIKAPGLWEAQGYPDVDGVAWYRRTIELPEAMTAKEASLSLAMIDDADETYVNGVQVGGEQVWNSKRVYKIPAERMTAGKMSIAIRVADTGGGGGIHGGDNEMFLEAAGEKVSLSGDWKFKLGSATEKLGKMPKHESFQGPNNPTALYNAMVKPIIPISFKGAIWYQGESNAGRAFQYRTLFPLLIKDWRAKWHAGRQRYSQKANAPTDDDHFPFYWVQLANFQQPNPEPAGSQWAELREAQSMTLKLPNTGEAVIIDIGEANDIHPKNKQDVGKRLALWALAKNYEKKIVYSGPRYKGMKIVDGKVELSFDHVGGGLVSRGDQLKRFEICGSDEKFVWAEAKIEGDKVIVSSDKIAEPVAVRYAWSNNPEGCNLYNKEGLPASPFRTDEFRGVTQY